MVCDVTKAKNYCVNLAVGNDSGDDPDEDVLTEIFFSNPINVDKQRLLDYLYKCASLMDDSPLKELTLEYIRTLRTDEDAYKQYYEEVRQKLLQTLSNKHINKDNFRLLKHNVYWQYYAVAIKKCTRNAGIVIDENDYRTKNRSILDGNNNYQEACHKLCLDFFNQNSNGFSISKTPMLWLFLHKIHTTCKKARTRKKNMNRVARKAKRVARMYKMYARKDTLFSYGRYNVIDQFKDCIVKCLEYAGTGDCNE